MQVLGGCYALAKYLLRVIHIGCIILICHKTINDFWVGEQTFDYAYYYMVIGAFVMISGFANTFLLKPKDMGEKRKLWIGFHHSKLLISLIIYGPVYKILPIKDDIHIWRFYWMVALIVISPYMRFYREFYVKKNQEIKKD